MSEQALFYKEVVPLNEQRHADFSVENAGDYSFSENTNAVYLSLAEFVKALHEFPIVFAGKDEKMSPVAILGLENNQNLFLNKHAKWIADYIPAYVRRYPFILADDGNNFTVCIDESFKGLNQNGKGQRLFDARGQQSDYLKRMVGFLQQYHAEHLRTQAFMAKLREYDLLEPMHANVELNSGAKVSLTGFLVVNKKRLKNLPAEKINQLMRDDMLEFIYTHLLSLDNFNRLMERFAAIDKAS